jgi:hypothetical protein
MCVCVGQQHFMYGVHGACVCVGQQKFIFGEHGACLCVGQQQFMPVRPFVATKENFRSYI